MNKFYFTLLISLVCIAGTKNVFAQASQSVFYVPLIGITSVPDPLALPNGAGNVTYHYAVKNFLAEVPLNNIRVVDDTCAPVIFVEGDDNNNSQLDYNETWRYSCTTKISTTTQSIATAIGTENNVTATHQAHATVVVGRKDPAPLVSIINITKVAYPLSLPPEGGPITFTYRVNNPGLVPLSDVTVKDDKCGAMSGRLGDTNGNNLLDIHEVWVYTCSTTLFKTTTNTAIVTAYANGLRAVGDDTITVEVKSPTFPQTGSTPNSQIIVWAILSFILFVLIILNIITRKRKLRK